MISVILYFLMLQANSETPQWGIHKTEKATVVAFDQKCVEVKMANGKKHKLDKTGFKNMKLETGKTKVSVHPETVAKSNCESEKN